MKLKSLLAILVAIVFVFAISCKEKEEEEAPAKTEVKAQGQAVEKAEAKEAEIVRGNQMGEIQVDPDGKIVEALKWAGKGEKEKA